MKFTQAYADWFAGELKGVVEKNDVAMLDRLGAKLKDIGLIFKETGGGVIRTDCKTEAGGGSCDNLSCTYGGGGNSCNGESCMHTSGGGSCSDSSCGNESGGGSCSGSVCESCNSKV